MKGEADLKQFGRTPSLYEGSGLQAESEGLLRKQNPKPRLMPANKQIGMGDNL